jgi:hypothetical protein
VALDLSGAGATVRAGRAWVEGARDLEKFPAHAAALAMIVEAGGGRRPSGRSSVEHVVFQ